MLNLVINYTTVFYNVMMATIFCTEEYLYLDPSNCTSVQHTTNVHCSRKEEDIFMFLMSPSHFTMYSMSSSHFTRHSMSSSHFISLCLDI